MRMGVGRPSAVQVHPTFQSTMICPNTGCTLLPHPHTFHTLLPPPLHLAGDECSQLRESSPPRRHLPLQRLDAIGVHVLGGRNLGEAAVG